eukprot:1483327-Karenia_brevis.AAC.1
MRAKGLAGRSIWEDYSLCVASSILNGQLIFGRGKAVSVSGEIGSLTKTVQPLFSRSSVHRLPQYIEQPSIYATVLCPVTRQHRQTP